MPLDPERHLAPGRSAPTTSGPMATTTLCDVPRWARAHGGRHRAPPGARVAPGLPRRPSAGRDRGRASSPARCATSRLDEAQGARGSPGREHTDFNLSPCRRAGGFPDPAGKRCPPPDPGAGLPPTRPTPEHPAGQMVHGKPLRDASSRRWAAARDPFTGGTFQATPHVITAPKTRATSRRFLLRPLLSTCTCTDRSSRWSRSARPMVRVQPAGARGHLTTQDPGRHPPAPASAPTAFRLPPPRPAGGPAGFSAGMPSVDAAHRGDVHPRPCPPRSGRAGKPEVLPSTSGSTF